MHCGTQRYRVRGCHAGTLHGHGVSCGCGCACHAGSRIPTREETVGRLERYLAHLQGEAQAVEERLAALRDE
jgi:hypothetical protein